MAKKTKPVEIVVVIDRSGSMGMIAADAIGGFNQFLKEQQALPGKANLSLALFDDEYLLVEDSTPIQNVNPLTSATYKPRGTTALYDAIGRSLLNLEKKNPDKAIICILTDGQENASTDFNRDQIRAGIKDVEARGWQVVYLAANQDAFSVGGSLGISAKGIANFQANSIGTRKAYSTTSLMCSDYRQLNVGKSLLDVQSKTGDSANA